MQKSPFILLTLIIFITLFSILGSLFVSIVMNTSEANNAVSHSEKREAIETIYTEFKDFEKQSSFAGKTVESQEGGGDDFFAYIVLGSGVKYAQVTCFKVGDDLKVEKVSTFPKPTDFTCQNLP